MDPRAETRATIPSLRRAANRLAMRRTAVELAGLEPATSWVRLHRLSLAYLQGFCGRPVWTTRPGVMRSLRDFCGIPSRERPRVMKFGAIPTVLGHDVWPGDAERGRAGSAERNALIGALVPEPPGRCTAGHRRQHWTSQGTDESGTTGAPKPRHSVVIALSSDRGPCRAPGDGRTRIRAAARIPRPTASAKISSVTRGLRYCSATPTPTTGNDTPA